MVGKQSVITSIRKDSVLLTRLLAEQRQELPTELQEVASDPLSYSEAVVHNSEEFFRSFNIH